MPEQIDSLTDEQALLALKMFIEDSPSEVWADGRRPTAARMEQVGDAVVRNAPEQLKSTVTTLDQAQVARFILNKLREAPDLQPAVENAIDSASRPHKFAIDPVTGAFLVACLLATSKFEHGKISLGANMPQILRELPAVIKAIPQGIRNRFTGNRGADTEAS